MATRLDSLLNKWLILLAVIAKTNAQVNYVEMFVGGSPEINIPLKKIQFFPDFREGRIFILSSNFDCNMMDDCEKDKTLVYTSEYSKFKYKYYVGKINMNYNEQRLIKNSIFNFIIESEEDMNMNVVGFNRDSEFLQLYFRQSAKKSELLRLSFSEEKGKFDQANPYLRKQAKAFSFYKNHQNRENFFLDMVLKVTENDLSPKVLLEEKIRLCPFSNPYLTNWDTVFFSGKKEIVDRLRNFFEDISGNKSKIDAQFIHRNSNFVLILDHIFDDKLISNVFKISYSEGDFCDLYFGFEFVKYFEMDFLFGYNEKEDKVDLFFQTVTEVPKPFGFGIIGAGLFVILALLIYVLCVSKGSKKTTVTGKSNSLGDKLVEA